MCIGVFVPWGDHPRSPGWVVEENGCHTWIGAICSGGYGNVVVKGKTRKAHRVRYERERGPVPIGMELDHLCRNRACVNPLHLEPVTRRENVKRGVGPLRSREWCAAVTHCPKGHEYTEENTYIQRRNGHNLRSCRICRRARLREYYARNRVKLVEYAQNKRDILKYAPIPKPVRDRRLRDLRDVA